MYILFLIKVKENAEEVNERVKELEEISKTVTNFGGWDLVATGDFRTTETATNFITEKLIHIEGVSEVQQKGL